MPILVLNSRNLTLLKDLVRISPSYFLVPMN
jgi:hypothetical protein